MESFHSSMVKFIKYPLVTAAFLFLGSCYGSNEQLMTPRGFYSYENLMGYKLAVPVGFTYSELAPSGTYYYFGYPNNSSTGLATVEIHDTDLTSPCSPLLTGASQMATLPDNQETQGGKVDFWDNHDQRNKIINAALQRGEEPPNPLCVPPAHPSGTMYFECPTAEEKQTLGPEEINRISCRQRQRDYEVQNGINSAYALCSEKNGKTVVICISQVTDDPDLAEQIFETFRWTE